MKQSMKTDLYKQNFCYVIFVKSFEVNWINHKQVYLKWNRIKHKNNSLPVYETTPSPKSLISIRERLYLSAISF